jgi:hypothetical protein
MKQYQLNIYQPEGGQPAPEVLTRIMQDVDALVTDTKEKGVWVFNGGLTPPSSATVVRVRGDETFLADGPFTESKEFIGGFLVIRVADLDEALAWAARLGRATTLPIEVRPFHGDV